MPPTKITPLPSLFFLRVVLLLASLLNTAPRALSSPSHAMHALPANPIYIVDAIPFMFLNAIPILRSLTAMLGNKMLMRASTMVSLSVSNVASLFLEISLLPSKDGAKVVTILTPSVFLLFNSIFFSLFFLSVSLSYLISHSVASLFFFIKNFLLFILFLFLFYLFYFILFYFILFYFILFYFILFYFILFYFILFYFILFYFILFYFILF